MCRLTSVAFLLFLLAGKSSGVEWVALAAGDPLPYGTIHFPEIGTFVGRARHFNSILIAEVWRNSTATIKVCGKTVTKHNFEVLTSSTPCSWQHLQIDEDLPEGLVRVGHQDANKALFVGWRHEYNRYYPNSDKMYSFSLSEAEIQNLIGQAGSALVCPTERQWIDVSAKKVPKTAVYAGKSTEGTDVFVARLQKECHIYPGEVLPGEGIATAWTDGELIEAHYCQVLIGDSNQYRWMSITDDDELPDNAVVGSTDRYNLYYIVKQLSNNVTTYVTNLFMGISGDYEILIDNGTKLMPAHPSNPPQIEYDNEDDELYEE